MIPLDELVLGNQVQRPGCAGSAVEVSPRTSEPRPHKDILLAMFNQVYRPEKCDACDLQFRAKEPFQSYDRGVRVDFVHLDCVKQYARDYGIPDEHETHMGCA